MGFREMATAMQARGITDGDVRVLVALAFHANAKKGDATFVGQETLAKELGKPRTSISKSMSRLEAVGYISRTRRASKIRGGRGSDTTRVNYEAIERGVLESGARMAKESSVTQQSTGYPQGCESYPQQRAETEHSENPMCSSERLNVQFEPIQRSKTEHLTSKEPTREPPSTRTRPSAAQPAPASPQGGGGYDPWADPDAELPTGYIDQMLAEMRARDAVDDGREWSAS